MADLDATVSGREYIALLSSHPQTRLVTLSLIESQSSGDEREELQRHRHAELIIRRKRDRGDSSAKPRHEYTAALDQSVDNRRSHHLDATSSLRNIRTRPVVSTDEWTSLDPEARVARFSDTGHHPGPPPAFVDQPIRSSDHKSRKARGIAAYAIVKPELGSPDLTVGVRIVQDPESPSCALNATPLPAQVRSHDASCPSRKLAQGSAGSETAGSEHPDRLLWPARERCLRRKIPVKDSGESMPTPGHDGDNGKCVKDRGSAGIEYEHSAQRKKGWREAKRGDR